MNSQKKNPKTSPKRKIKYLEKKNLPKPTVREQMPCVTSCP